MSTRERALEPRPHVVRASDAALADLERRLEAARWPEPEPPADEGWAQGTPGPWLRELVAYWREGFDWRDREAWLARA